MFSVDVNDTIQKLQQMGARKILLQLPDGLKPHAFDYFNALSAKFSVIISSDPFYGACDVGNAEQYRDVDCIVQYGHSEIPNVKYPKPMIFQEARNETAVTINPEIFGILVQSGFKRIGLLSSIQYMDRMMETRKILENLGLKVVVGRQDSRIAYPGQVLGCNFSSAHSISMDVDAYLIVSTGKFHAIGVQLSTDKEVFLLDLNYLSLQTIRDEKDSFLRKRYARISKALDAKKFCVVFDTKIGQYRKRLADVLMTQIREMGKDGVLLSANEVKPSDYENLRCDAVIFTGCPRVPIDDEDRFSMPILTPPEFQTLFGFKKTKNYVMDEIVEVDDLP
ncbi:S-adenosyl-L-methionine:L-histidine 3-amino-3-carboxypropyltransferase [Thermoplasmatales archaeon]|nr:S-adenosyl-L-methionine:L-histidine 3-amino-3-carboxypropyltransferase [Thermoplasmatales archaeon]